MKNIENQVAEIIARAVMIPVTDVKPEAKLSDLGVTSLDQVECVIAVEETFHVEIDRSDVRELRTVRDVIEAVKRELTTSVRP